MELGGPLQNTALGAYPTTSLMMFYNPSNRAPVDTRIHYPSNQVPVEATRSGVDFLNVVPQGYQGIDRGYAYPENLSDEDENLSDEDENSHHSNPSFQGLLG